MAFVKNPLVIGIACSVAINLLSFIGYRLLTKHKSTLVKIAKVVQRIPDYLLEAEQVLGAGQGTRKLAYALHLVKIICDSLGVDYEKYEAGFIGEIERILATPQKHDTSVVNENEKQD